EPVSENRYAPPTPEPTPEDTAGAVELTYPTAIALGGAHSCVLLNNGRIKCWGRNDNGEIGSGTPIGDRLDITIDNNIYEPEYVVGIDNAISISSGGSHTCALLDDNTISCWGSSYFGQLGKKGRWGFNTHQIVDGISDVIEVGTGVSHTCVLLNDGNIKCWGDNHLVQVQKNAASADYCPFEDQLSNVGDNYKNCVYLPETIIGDWVSDATSISAGNGHSCVTLSNGEVICWGHNYYGQIGAGTSEYLSTKYDVRCPGVLSSSIRYNCIQPIESSGISTAMKIIVGLNHNFAVLQNGNVMGWGSNQSGQLGDGTSTSQSTPVEIGVLSGITKIVAGSSHSCAIFQGNSVKCWGNNQYGQLGNGTFGDGTESISPVGVIGLADVEDIATRGNHTCVIENKQVKCWGYNNYGQLGNESEMNAGSPLNSKPVIVDL
ncbi:MAG: hypothetical protein O2900_04625, partial [Proteobacteria bacterium]|nr:hypothetical protein [Pseudomonadota bacterium]